jgi:hypothetical protein
MTEQGFGLLLLSAATIVDGLLAGASVDQSVDNYRLGIASASAPITPLPTIDSFESFAVSSEPVVSLARNYSGR